ncbi:MAG TPA: gephyrin-like molybdotransferase Glp [Bacteroidia bacterium]|nr:gephyrin-like molybdotransferase Glp [Bacteroidia bacterium]
MISVVEAKKLIDDNTKLLQSEMVQLYEATGCILAQDIFSPMDTPPFNQSAMDGFAFRFQDWDGKNKLKVIGEIQAGNYFSGMLKKGEAIRIFTGAPVPDGADTVVMQEKVSVVEKQLFINDSQLKKGANIRLKGSHTGKGNLAMKSGSKITPGAAGFLSGMGFSEVKVFPFPWVCIITTGKELMQPGNKLENGQVYECNSYSLNAALSELGIKRKKIFSVDDNENKITVLIRKNLPDCDVMIVTGGVSVGDYDFVNKAFENCGVKTIFHKVKQKPGKPVFFGTYRNTLVFGLPGNPAAVLSCYYEYIVPALRKMIGFEKGMETKYKLPLSSSFIKKGGLTYFLKGKISVNEVIPLQQQESYQMNSFVFADCIIELEENKTDYHKGEIVEVHPLN